MKRREKGNEQPRTPIIDGDARPDINIDPEDASEKDTTSEENKSKTTKNRNDRNSLEDFRDAKQE